MKVEVAIPCYNEGQTVGKVVQDFRAQLPEADIVVYDNNSRDQTTVRAREAGARVIRVSRQGKGYVVQTVFEESNADIVVMVDGDDTYEAADVGSLIKPLQERAADMTIGTRLHSSPEEFRRLHHLGNRGLTWCLNRLFNTRYEDILSGYRAFNRRFMQTVPFLSGGFEIETEMMVQSCEHGLVVREIPIRFRNRPQGSVSKLHTMRDGYRILLLMTALLRDHRPLFVFSVAALLAVAAGVPIWWWGYAHAGGGSIFTVLRSVGAVLILASVGLFFIGLILNAVNTRMRELASLLRRKRF